MAVIGSAQLQFMILLAALLVCTLPAGAAPAGLQQALAYAKAHQQTLNEQLMDLIAIPSISALPGVKRAWFAGCRVHLHDSA